MKYDSYQHVGLKSFFINLIKNGAPAIFVFFIFIALAIIKAVGIETFLSIFNTPDLITFADVLLNWILLAAFVFTILLCGIGLLITAIDYFTFYFMVDEHGLHLKHGLLHKREISIPYRHMQDISINSSLIFQIFGVCKLNIVTEGEITDINQGDAVEATFPIVDKTLAYELRELLLSQSNVEIEVEGQKSVTA